MRIILERPNLVYDESKKFDDSKFIPKVWNAQLSGVVIPPDPEESLHRRNHWDRFFKDYDADRKAGFIFHYYKIKF